MASGVVCFHEKAVALRPNQPSKPSTYWVAILNEEKLPSHSLVELDFLWIKCHGKITVKVIKDQYRTRNASTEETFFRHGNTILEDQKSMAELNTHGDNLIAMEAIRKSDFLARTSPLPSQASKPIREALQPKLERFSPNVVASRQPQLTNSSSFTSGDENTSPLANLSPLDSKADLRQLASQRQELQGSPGRSQRPSQLPPTALEQHNTGIHGFEDLRRKCGFYDFIHQELMSWEPRLDSGARSQYIPATKEWLPLRVDINGMVVLIQRSITKWNTMPELAREEHRVKATFFMQEVVHKPVVLPSQETLIHFIAENAAFYKWWGEPEEQRYFELLRVTRRLTLALAFQTMVQTWKAIPHASKTYYSGVAKTNPTFSTIAVDFSARDGCRPPQAHPVTAPVAPPEAPPATRETSTPPDSTQAQIFQLQKLFAGSGPELLEAAVEKGVEVLKGLRKPLEGSDDAEAVQWLQSIENVERQAVRTKTIVGVVGNTGAGKSSVINAMLDEERLVPTNCMRACTAVVTEISYNHEEIPYRAEIEFVTAQDWEKELKILFEDLLDGDGNISRGATNEESAEGVAYAKIKAVYPKYTREMIQKSSVNQLMKHGNVRNILGSKREISNSDSLMFYKKLQFFVDSKEKSTSAKDKNNKDKAPREMEFWPLIKVVRLYVKSEALSTGAVIVDLPGVHDSNAARSAVAEGYMKQCTGLWIVAPINRAVDDKAAKSLLGESFKRQLKMDGGFSTVTFICSKTDDISLTEAQESLGLEEEMGALWAESDCNTSEKQRLKKELEEIKETKEVYAAAIDDAEGQLETWEKLQEEMEDGKTVYAPREGAKSPSKKRKRGSPKQSKRKKQRRVGSDDESDYKEQTSDDEVEEPEEDEDSETQARGDPLTSEAIEDKIADLKKVKRDGRRQKLGIDEQLKAVRKQISEIDVAEDKVQAELSAICISGRNQYSKGAIQADFASGIKELDQELAEEEDAANFNPDVDARDYEEVARSLPVFCVSSRGYQKLKGRLRKDPAVPGFKAISETEIPQLQAHCKKLTEAGREANCRRFLNSLSQLLNSLRLWSSNDGTGAHLTEGQKAREAQILHDRLKKLDTDLEKHVKSVCQGVRDQLADNIFDVFGPAVSAATNEANPIALHWGEKVNRDQRHLGGYFWATYKAICRRDGVYSNAQGPHDWNAQLIEPVIKAVASGWEKTFSRCAPHVFTTFATNASQTLKTFHNDVEKRASRNGGAVASLQMLSHQLQNYRELFKDISTTSSTMATNQAKEINREFQPVIADAVGPAYAGCVAESGTGSFMRMKHIMTGHIDNVRHTMFTDSTKKVQRSLKDTMNAVEMNMMASMDTVFLSVKRDYSSAVIGSQSATGKALPRQQRIMRSNVLEAVQGSEKSFKIIAGVETEEEQQDDDQQDDANTGSTQEGPTRPKEESTQGGDEDHVMGLKAEAESRDQSVPQHAETDNASIKSDSEAAVGQEAISSSSEENDIEEPNGVVETSDSEAGEEDSRIDGLDDDRGLGESRSPHDDLDSNFDVGDSAEPGSDDSESAFEAMDDE